MAVSEASEEGVTGSVGFKFGGAPPPEVSAYFRDKNLRPAFNWGEVWGQEHAYSFTVAKAVQLDVLTAIRDSLQTAIDQGVPYEAWAKALKPELEAKGWWGKKDVQNPTTGEVKTAQLGSPRRLKTIYDANLRTARAAGQWERAQRTQAVLPYFVYELGPSIHHRQEHVDRAGMIAPVDSPVWDSWYPPNGWGCKCWLSQITRRQADARGGEWSEEDLADTAPPKTYTRKRDDGSRESVTVPKGIDPGWATNPGKSRASTLMRSLTGKLVTAGPEVAKAVITPLWQGKTAETLPSLPGRFFAPVAIVPQTVQAAVGATAPVMMVSSDQMRVKLDDPNKHGERPLRVADFGRIQAILDDGEIVESDGRFASAILEMEDGWWKVAFKSAAAGRELIVSTLFPIMQRRADKLRKKAGKE